MSWCCSFTHVNICPQYSEIGDGSLGWKHVIRFVKTNFVNGWIIWHFFVSPSQSLVLYYLFLVGIQPPFSHFPIDSFYLQRRNISKTRDLIKQHLILIAWTKNLRRNYRRNFFFFNQKKIFNLSFLFRLTYESYSEEKKIIKENPGKIIGSGDCSSSA